VGIDAQTGRGVRKNEGARGPKTIYSQEKLAAKGRGVLYLGISNKTRNSA